MLILDDIKIKYRELKDKFDSCAAAVDLSALKSRREEVEKEQQSPDLYSDLKRAQAVGSEAKYLDTKIALVEALPPGPYRAEVAGCRYAQRPAAARHGYAARRQATQKAPGKRPIHIYYRRRYVSSDKLF